jgi:hypothetical protein
MSIVRLSASLVAASLLVGAPVFAQPAQTGKQKTQETLPPDTTTNANLKQKTQETLPPDTTTNAKLKQRTQESATLPQDPGPLKTRP